jgi:hypothetical protein
MQIYLMRYLGLCRVDGGFSYIIKNGGVTNIENYPWTGWENPKCKSHREEEYAPFWHISALVPSSCACDQTPVNLLKGGVCVDQHPVQPSFALYVMKNYLPLSVYAFDAPLVAILALRLLIGYAQEVRCPHAPGMAPVRFATWVKHGRALVTEC